MAENTLHTPVMLERTLELLAPALERPGAVLVDATLGLGGHAEAFLERFPELVFVGLDRDPHALELTGQRLAPFGARVHLVHTVYDRVGEVLSVFRGRLIEVMAAETGKTIAEADVEVSEAVDFAHYYAARARGYGGAATPRCERPSHWRLTAKAPRPQMPFQKPHSAPI